MSSYIHGKSIIIIVIKIMIIRMIIIIIIIIIILIIMIKIYAGMNYSIWRNDAKCLSSFSLKYLLVLLLTICAGTEFQIFTISRNIKRQVKRNTPVDGKEIMETAKEI